MPAYRNQTPTLTQIQMMSRMRITTAQEAVAFLRAVAPLNEQVAYVLQRSSLREQQAINNADMASRRTQTEPTPTPVTTTVSSLAEDDKTFVPEDLSSDEGYSDTEVEAKVAKLKKARKK